MRILHINDIANVGATLVEGLTQLGHAVELRRLRLVAGGYPTAIKLLAVPMRLQEFVAVNRQVQAGHYDVVHIHYAYLGWLGITGRYSYFLHCHGTDLRSGLRDPTRRWLVIQSLKRAQAVFFVTPDLAPLAHSIRPDAIFLPDPVNIDRFRPTVESNNRPLKVLIISAISQVKNIRVAFEAVHQLLNRYPEVRVTAINHGPNRQFYHGTPGVVFTRPVPYGVMPDLINAHDVVVGQFGIGSLGMAELESMACGKPVICHSAYGDWYKEAPPVFAANRPTQVAEFLSALVEDADLRRERGQHGRVWVQQYHGYTTIARRLEQIYAQCQ